MPKEKTRKRKPFESLRLVSLPKKKANLDTDKRGSKDGGFEAEEWFSEHEFKPNPLFYDFEDALPYLRAINKLLEMVEETWTPIDHDTLTEVEERTLVWMEVSGFERKFRETQQLKTSIREYRLTMFGRYDKSLLHAGRLSEMHDSVLACEPETVSDRRKFISDQMLLLSLGQESRPRIVPASEMMKWLGNELRTKVQGRKPHSISKQAKPERWNLDKLQGPAGKCAKELMEENGTETVTIRELRKRIGEKYKREPAVSTLYKTVAWKEYGNRKTRHADPSKAAHAGDSIGSFSEDDDRRREAGSLEQLPGESDDKYSRRLEKEADSLMGNAPN